MLRRGTDKDLNRSLMEDEGDFADAAEDTGICCDELSNNYNQMESISQDVKARRASKEMIEEL